MADWSLQYGRQLYTAEMLTITRKDAGFHATAASAQPEQVETFDISILAAKLRAKAPNLWRLLSCLVDARGSVRRARMPDSPGSPATESWIVGAAAGVPRHLDLIAIADEPVAEDPEDEEDEEDAVASADSVDDAPRDSDPANARRPDDMDVDVPAPPPLQESVQPVRPAAKPSKAAICNAKLTEVQIVQMFGLAQNATNQHCNAIQMHMCILLRMMHVSDSVVGVLNHAGLVVSNKSIDRAVSSLSKAEEKRLLLQGATLTSQKAFDNFNFMERVAVPTAGRDSLYRSAISALNIPSHPTLTPAHFKWAEGDLLDINSLRQ
ncbi:hypothetical protein AURDEDRAFT_126734 [Auricularia subglabra TFB-10046 SS5]|nr:hypothetical protein AURDEDRAFT_126734 [Auricularia subglabra TFB-10046 SS5]